MSIIVMGDQAAGDPWYSYAKACMAATLRNYLRNNAFISQWYYPTDDVKVFVRMIARQPQALIYVEGGFKILVWPISDSAPDGWGEPFNPPVGTIGGLNPNVLLDYTDKASPAKRLKINTRGLVESKAGNCYWIDTKKKAITWWGPDGQDIGYNIGNDGQTALTYVTIKNLWYSSYFIGGKEYSIPYSIIGMGRVKATIIAATLSALNQITFYYKKESVWVSAGNITFTDAVGVCHAIGNIFKFSPDGLKGGIVVTYEFPIEVSPPGSHLRNWSQDSPHIRTSLTHCEFSLSVDGDVTFTHTTTKPKGLYYEATCNFSIGYGATALDETITSTVTLAKIDDFQYLGVGYRASTDPNAPKTYNEFTLISRIDTCTGTLNEYSTQTNPYPSITAANSTTNMDLKASVYIRDELTHEEISPPSVQSALPKYSIFETVRTYSGTSSSYVAETITAIFDSTWQETTSSISHGAIVFADIEQNVVVLTRLEAHLSHASTYHLDAERPGGGDPMTELNGFITLGSKIDTSLQHTPYREVNIQTTKHEIDGFYGLSGNPFLPWGIANDRLGFQYSTSNNLPWAGSLTVQLYLPPFSSIPTYVPNYTTYYLSVAGFTPISELWFNHWKKTGGGNYPTIGNPQLSGVAPDAGVLVGTLNIREYYTPTANEPAVSKDHIINIMEDLISQTTLTTPEDLLQVYGTNISLNKVRLI